MRHDIVLMIIALLLSDPTDGQVLGPPPLPSTPPLASLPPLPARPQLPSLPTLPPLPQIPSLPDLPDLSPSSSSPAPFSPNAFPPPPCRTFFCLHQPPQLIITIQWHETSDASTAGSDDQQVLTLTNIASNKLLMVMRFDVLVSKLQDLVGDIGDALGLGDGGLKKRDERRDLLAMTATLLPTASAPLVFEMPTAIVTSWIEPMIEVMELTVQTVGGTDGNASDLSGNMTLPTGTQPWGTGLPMGTESGLPLGTGLPSGTVPGPALGTGLPLSNVSPVNRAAAISFPRGTGTQTKPLLTGSRPPIPITTTMSKNATVTPTPRLVTGTGHSIPLLTGTGPYSPKITGTHMSLPAWMSMFLPTSTTSTTTFPTSLFYVQTGPATRVTRTVLRATQSGVATAVAASATVSAGR